jgi:hypothetical protein
MDDSTSPFDPLFSYARHARIDTSHLAGSSYASGYFLPAHLLAIHVRENRLDRNLLAPPICYLLRHNLELNLKELIVVGQRGIGTTIPSIKHHRLTDLWAVGKDLLRRADPNKPDPAEFLRVDRLIDHISEVDADAQAFRFPKRVDGTRSLTNVKEIDLESLTEMVNSATLYIWGCIDWFDTLEAPQ